MTDADRVRHQRVAITPHIGMADAATLCRLEDIPHNTGKEFLVSLGAAQVAIFVVRRGQHVYAYRNVCPHKGLSLNWQPNRFMDDSGAYLHCTNHDALFCVEDGVCVAGPCHGARLKPVKIQVTADGEIVTV